MHIQISNDRLMVMQKAVLVYYRHGYSALTLNKIVSVHVVLLLCHLFIKVSLHSSQTEILEAKYFYLFKAEATENIFPLDLLLYFYKNLG